jgi:hypothetical protein
LPATRQATRSPSTVIVRGFMCIQRDLSEVMIA